ncbi:MAG: hypothetical protein P9F75_15660 [Candidatus Contendobacter sp.]|nr:hypothetical protein [Candidatus Contendobacter sp.]
MKPVLLIFFIVIIATAPTTLGQSIYKCPGPNGLSYYQQTPCPQGARMVSQDNGKESGTQDAAPPSPVAPPTPPPAESSGPGEIATVPVQGQSIYKCPGPNELSYYQQTPCPRGARMVIQDNGKESSDTAQKELPAETSGLREGEQRWLQAIRQREAESARWKYEGTAGGTAGGSAWQGAERARVTQTQTSPTESNSPRAQTSSTESNGWSDEAVREIRRRQEENERRYRELVGQSSRVESNHYHEYSQKDIQQRWRMDENRDIQQRWRMGR